ncbi:MAG: HNH endonuclease, partial [Saprospiraceae bacterium]|nr:HNH endonuclease [Saprospiraceae bacterium]
THVFGRTAVGRATVEKLGLNRMGVVNLREVLVMVGTHPPF